MCLLSQRGTRRPSMVEESSRAGKRVREPRTLQGPRAKQNQIEKASNLESVSPIFSSQLVSDDRHKVTDFETEDFIIFNYHKDRKLLYTSCSPHW